MHVSPLAHHAHISCVAHSPHVRRSPHAGTTGQLPESSQTQEGHGTSLCGPLASPPIQVSVDRPDIFSFWKNGISLILAPGTQTELAQRTYNSQYPHPLLTQGRQAVTATMPPQDTPRIGIKLRCEGSEVCGRGHTPL